MSKSFLRPLLSITFPQGFQKSKSVDIGLKEMGAKRRLNGVNNYKKIRKKKNLFTAAILNHFEPLFTNLKLLLSITFPQGFQIF